MPIPIKLINSFITSGTSYPLSPRSFTHSLISLANNSSIPVMYQVFSQRLGTLKIKTEPLNKTQGADSVVRESETQSDSKALQLVR